MNSVTSIFVDSVREYSEKDNNAVMSDQLSRKHEYMSKVNALFRSIDDDNSGEVTYEEFQGFMGQDEMLAFASSIDIESQDLDQFFCILSSNGERPVDVESFVVGCIKLRGVARAMDMVDCLINIRAVYDVQRELQARFQELQVLLGAPPEGPGDVPQPPERALAHKEMVVHENTQVP